MKRVYVVGTADTKGPELQYVKSLIEAAGGPRSWSMSGFVARKCRRRRGARSRRSAIRQGGRVLGGDDRGAAVEAMGEAFAHFIVSRTDIAGIVGIGGGGGTSIVTAGMRRLPVGLPKFMVSTLAAGDVGQFVGASDIAMMYSVTDVAGLNRISRVVLGNAAHAIAGMVHAPAANVNRQSASRCSA